MKNFPIPTEIQSNVDRNTSITSKCQIDPRYIKTGVINRYRSWDRHIWRLDHHGHTSVKD